MSHHILKLKQEFWDAVKSGDKCFEVRLNDRGFQKGDTVSFNDLGGGVMCTREYVPYIFEITYVLSGWGIKEDHVVFGIKPKRSEGDSE